MSIEARYYRDFIRRVVADPDPTLLERMAERLAEAEEAHQTLRAKGHGRAGQSIAEVAKSVPEKRQ